MNQFSRIYENLDEYMKPGNCPTDHEGSISNHRLSLYQLEKMGVKEKLKLKFDLHEHFPLIRRKYFLTQA